MDNDHSNEKYRLANEILAKAMSDFTYESNSVLEAVRLATLLNFKILDTEPEPEYNDIVALACAVTNTPVAALVFVDDYRAWIKAMNTPYFPANNERKHSFCNYAIMQKETLVINDASTDPLTETNPWVTGEYDELRFYAGSPLVSVDGSIIGALCVIDHQPRDISDDQVKGLETLARLVMSFLDTRKS